MAAGTDIRNSANKKASYRRIRQFKSDVVAREQRPDGGIYVFDTGDVAVAATNTETVDDILLVFQFPLGAKLLGLKTVWSDLDTGALLIANTVVRTEAGAETVLMTGHNMQTAGSKDVLDAGKLFTDVGGQYLGFHVTTGSGAGATTGTIRYYGMFYMGDMITGF